MKKIVYTLLTFSAFAFFIASCSSISSPKAEGSSCGKEQKHACKKDKHSHTGGSCDKSTTDTTTTTTTGL